MSTDAQSPVTAKAASLPAGTEACPRPASLLQMTCQVFVTHTSKAAGVVMRAHSATKAATINGALGPADLQAAYGLASASANDGTGETVAIVDAYGDPSIGSDLMGYEHTWATPATSSTPGTPVCANASGIGTTASCLSVFNESGEASPLPNAPTGDNLTWEDETALDVEMTWAICPNCHIDLFQASSPNLSDLGTAENSAVKVSKFVSNSWSGGDFPGESAYDAAYFNHPGEVMDFAVGDYGFGATYPGSSGLVTSVGGTYLTSSSDSRGYSESVWTGQSTGPGTGTGAGCSSGEGKPSWQTDTGCTNRTQNDIAAVADAPDGIDEYSSSGDCNDIFANQCQVYGTSVATPIITAIFALAGSPAQNTYPVSYLYQHAGNTADFNRVTSGKIGTCESSRLYLCDASDSLSNGYNGPTGLGTPNGIGGFENSIPSTTDIVSADNPGTYDLTAGTHITLPAIKAYDSNSSTLTYSQTGLPSGVSMNSATGIISGTLPGNAVNDKITVTVKDGTGASAAIHFSLVAVKAMNGSYHAVAGEVKLVHVNKTCMNDPHNDTHVDAPVATYQCAVSSSQDWTYSMPAGPGQAGRITIHGKCVNILGSTKAGNHLIGLVNCANSSTQLWDLTGYDGEIVNPGTGDCLTDPGSTTTANTQFQAQPCTGISGQTIVPPSSPVTNGIAGKCLAISDGSAISTACSGAASQEVTLGLDGSLQFNGECIYNAGSSALDGTAIKVLKCNEDNYSEEWGISAYGQIENLTTEKCLANPTNSVTNGTKLELEDCYGQQGELWAVS